jgi:hypothetical protein
VIVIVVVVEVYVLVPNIAFQDVPDGNPLSVKVTEYVTALTTRVTVPL